ncbi:MAG TPA: hypothetical protein PL185_07985, partial [Flavobacteriales bacterium]|nr:hypothetical protein [Flavobacteriales bacterium]
MSAFKNRPLVIATMHHKEKVIAPILEQHLQVQCFLPDGFNSDVYGTFSGEIERNNSPLNTAREKCLAAMKLTNCDLGIASEGSFGPHPSYLFIPANEEIIVLIDDKNKWEIYARIIHTKTNFASEEIKSESELSSFLNQVHFPSHGIILKSESEIYKGLHDEMKVRKLFRQMNIRTGKVRIETDMRAMHNPTRMESIQLACEELLKKINSLCPSCKTPGFVITRVETGLACSHCGMPSNQ